MYEVWSDTQQATHRLGVYNDKTELEPALLQAFSVAADPSLPTDGSVRLTFRGQTLLTVQPSGARLFKEYISDNRRDEEVGEDVTKERRDPTPST